LFKLKSKIVSAVTRVSKDELIGYADVIMTRISSKISFHFSKSNIHKDPELMREE